MLGQAQLRKLELEAANGRKVLRVGELRATGDDDGGLRGVLADSESFEEGARHG